MLCHQLSGIREGERVGSLRMANAGNLTQYKLEVDVSSCTGQYGAFASSNPISYCQSPDGRLGARASGRLGAEMRITRALLKGLE